jgi:hypothetical protein
MRQVTGTQRRTPTRGNLYHAQNDPDDDAPDSERCHGDHHPSYRRHGNDAPKAATAVDVAQLRSAIGAAESILNCKQPIN